MRISTKGRYALAAVMLMARNYQSGESVTVISISEKLGISKIYLEQVFSLLKRGEIVLSIKGAQGGYQLSRPPHQITAFDILSAVELSLFEKAEKTVLEKAPDIELTLNADVFDVVDSTLKETLEKVTVWDLVQDAEKYKNKQGIMYYI